MCDECHPCPGKAGGSREPAAGSDHEAPASKNFPAQPLMMTMAVPTIRKIDATKPRMIGMSQSEKKPRIVAERGSSGS